MNVIPTITMEMTFGVPILDAEDNPILDAEGFEICDADWNVDVLEDVRMSTPIVIKRGTTGGEQEDRVADIGTMTFAMNNSQSNSVGIIGYYSPSNANVRDAFNEATLSRLKISYGSYERYKFQGIRLDKIDPDDGIYGNRATRVTAVDWMDEATITPAQGLTTQISQRDNELLVSILATMDNPPESTDFAVGPDQYALAPTDVRSDSDKVIGIIQSTMKSGLGKTFLVGNSTSGEVLKYLTRHYFMSETVPVAVIDNSMLSLSAPRKARSRVNKVIGTTHPALVDTAATTVLFQTVKEYSIEAGETLQFSGNYRDPSGGNTRINGVDIVDPLVAGTDFNFSSTPGAGSDLNAYLVHDIDPFSDYCDFTFTNTAGVTGYLRVGVQARGKGVYLYDPVSYTATDTTIEKGQTLEWDMPYQDSYITGKNITDALLVWESVEENERPVVKFNANRNETLMQYAIEVEPMDLVTITETVTGIDKNYFVNGVEYDIAHGGRRLDVTWYLAPAPEGPDLGYWTLDLAGHTELDSTTILAF